jgi:hypothetical protein
VVVAGLSAAVERHSQIREGDVLLCIAGWRLDGPGGAEAGLVAALGEAAAVLGKAPPPPPSPPLNAQAPGIVFQKPRHRGINMPCSYFSVVRGASLSIVRTRPDFACRAPPQWSGVSGWTRWCHGSCSQPLSPSSSSVRELCGVP